MIARRPACMNVFVAVPSYSIRIQNLIPVPVGRVFTMLPIRRASVSNETCPSAWCVMKLCVPVVVRISGMFFRMAHSPPGNVSASIRRLWSSTKKSNNRCCCRIRRRCCQQANDDDAGKDRSSTEDWATHPSHHAGTSGFRLYLPVSLAMSMTCPSMAVSTSAAVKRSPTGTFSRSVAYSVK
jgi:hypothetical protein